MQNAANLMKRTITTLVLAPVVLFTIWSGGILFKSLILGICAVMMIEMVNISFHAGAKFSRIKSVIFSAFGVTYIVIASVCIIAIRDVEPFGMELSYWLFLTVWSVDVGAYVFGNIIGGPKLLPVVSPTKTWSGLIGGCAFAVLVGACMTAIMPSITPRYIFLSGVTAFVAQCGDLLESFVKRIVKVKDSGNILPGHGGMLDRMDGLMLAAIFVCLVLSVM